MLKFASAFALAAVIGVGASVASTASAQTVPSGKYYDITKREWVPLAEHPFFEQQAKMRAEREKRQAQQRPTRTASAATRSSRSSSSTRTGIFRNEAVQRASVARRTGNQSPIPKKMVAFSGNYSKGTIVIDHSDRRLYHVQGNGMAMAYAVGVGKEGFAWTGTNKITRKAEWPGWTPPPQMIAREKAKGRILPAHMEGGPNNPLGARALYLGSTLYRIHGTNQPWSLGQAVSSGCIRMANDDVSYLYGKVGIGTRVVVRP